MAGRAVKMYTEDMARREEGEERGGMGTLYAVHQNETFSPSYMRRDKGRGDK